MGLFSGQVKTVLRQIVFSEKALPNMVEEFTSIPLQTIVRLGVADSIITMLQLTVEQSTVTHQK